MVNYTLCATGPMCIITAKLVLSEKTNEEKSREVNENRTAGIHQAAAGRRGSLQLWQFLVALLDAPDASAGCIAWTGRGMEFKLIEPEEVTIYKVLSDILLSMLFCKCR